MATSQALQFTLDQVAEHLGLPKGAVRRLSQYFQIPKGYYTACERRSRLLLYQPAEMEALKKIQEWLAAGKTLSQIKPLLESKGAEPSQPATPFRTDEEDRERGEIILRALVQYEQNDALKQQLAQITFNQYCRKNILQKSPFKLLAKVLQEQRTAQESCKTGDGPHYSCDSTSHELINPESQARFPGMAPSNSWRYSPSGDAG